MRMLKNEGGFVKFVATILLLAFAVYAGIKFGMPWYRYSAFKSETKELARISVGDVQRTKSLILDKAYELKLPIVEDDLAVRKTDKTVIVKTSWSETVDLLGVYQQELYFHIDIEE